MNYFYLLTGSLTKLQIQAWELKRFIILKSMFLFSLVLIRLILIPKYECTQNIRSSIH